MEVTTGKPLQRTTWAQKNAKNQQWFRDNGDHLIAGSLFGDAVGAGNRAANIRTLYEIYNSKFPSQWFRHVTDPFASSGSEKGKVWPAKIRPMNILRPNIDYLWGEYTKRPFNYQVVVKGEDGYNSFLEGKKKAAYKSVSQIFINTLNEEAAKLQESQGVEMDTGVDSKPVEMPDAVVEKFIASFKNTLATQAQGDLDLIMDDQRVREKFKDMMKDWLVSGEVHSYKGVIRDETHYDRVDPAEMDFDRALGKKNGEDGSWAVRRMLMDRADVVDRFFDSLKPKEIDQMEDGSYSVSPGHFHNYLSGQLHDSSKVPVYHYTWRTYEKIGILTYYNPITGQVEEDEVNDTWKADEELGESIEWFWRSRWMEGYRIGTDIHVEMGPVRFAPSMMNDYSKTRGPYNCRMFSDTHSENISPLKLGLPFQIMYIISNFALERTIAKSRGKIVLLDRNVIPRAEGWNDEKFFHFSEAQGWGLIDRNQVGVDKSFNQYQVLDLGLFDHIDNLIGIMDFCKRQYDEQLGISRQSKAQVGTQESVGGIEQAIFQSSIITEMIYNGFEEFVRSELEGLLDCSQISNIHGKRSSWVSDDGRTELLDIIGEEYSYAQMGIFMSDSTKDNDALKRIRTYTQAMAQNGMPASAIVAVETATNISKLQQILLKVESRQQELEMAAAESEQEAQLAQIELTQQFNEYNALLETQKMHEEYNRKEDLVLLQGDINMALAAGEQGKTDPSVAGTEALMKYSTESAKIEAENDRKNKELASRVQAQKDKEKRAADMDNHKKKIADKEFALKVDIKKKELQIKKQQAKAKPKAK